jgi:thiamine-monophosphate kinase
MVQTCFTLVGTFSSGLGGLFGARAPARTNARTFALCAGIGRHRCARIAWLGLCTGRQAGGRRRKIAESGESVADLGEWGVIAAVTARMPAGTLASVGIGDDAAVVAAPSGSVVAAVDLLIEGRHFRRDWSSAHDVGVKAAARSLADIAAMGAVNTALLVALAAPGTLPVRWATDLAEGLASEATRAGAGIVGGDTARADLVTLSVTALGDLEGHRPVLRSGARPGDVVAVAGPLGRSAAGLALLASGTAADSAALAGLVAAHLRPAPGYEAGPEAARLGATAMIDVSDGLLADLGHVAEASGARVNLDSRALAPDAALREAAARLPATAGSSATAAGCSARPVSPARGQRAGSPHQSPHDDRVAAAAWADPGAAMALNWVLTGGEDHALVAAFPPGVALPGHWRVIGQVLPGTGVTVDGTPHAGPVGWQHFR